MKRNLFVYILSVCMLMGMNTFTSCEDDIDTAQPGSKWNTTYVTLHPADYLSPLNSFKLSHSLEQGVSGNVELPIIAMTSKVATQDILVEIGISGNLPVDVGNISLSASSLEVKAGNTKSDPVTLSITDWSFLNEIKDLQEYELILQVKAVTSADKNIAVGEFNHQIKLKIIKDLAK